MKKILEIKLKSDLCAGSGKSLGSLIDSDVCFDEYGLVYIPSKRIKGLLKESFIEYSDLIRTDENTQELNDLSNNLFGVEGNNNSCDLIIDNAYLENVEKIKDDIGNIEEKYKKYLSKQRVANANTYVRYQTAVENETGVAEENSLRATRVVASGTIFYANVEIKTNKELEILEKCTKLVTHMGTNRTRGYGEVICTIKDIEEQKNENISYNFIDNSNYKISLLLRADSNIMVSKQNSEISEDYIPGSNIMGAIASKYIENNNIDFDKLSREYQDLFLNGTVKYSNAYITDKDGKIKYYPAPLSFSKVKDKSNQYHNKMYDVNEENIQLSNIGNKYVSLDGNNYIKEVKQSESYHHQRAKDLKVGHVSTRDEGGAFYQFTSIDMNQCFLTEIEIPGKYAKIILNFLDKDEVLRVGKSKTAEYGKLTIKDIQIAEEKQETKRYKKFGVVLTSPLILFDKENVKIANSKDSLIRELKELFGDKELNATKAFIGYSDESGYNAIWNLPKEQLISFEKGTTICFESTNENELKEEYSLGLKQNEGYGKLIIYPMQENGSSILQLKEYKNTDIEKIKYNELQNQTKKILNNSIKKVIKEEIQEKAFNEIYTIDSKTQKIKKVNIKLNNTTIGRVLLMLQESNTLEEFMNNIEAIKDMKKLHKILQVIKDNSKIQELQSYKDYESINNNITQTNLNEFKLDYIKQLFTILKIEGGEE